MGALDGIKVLDLAILIQGPQATSMLADLGAEVLKIELPELGDIARWVTVSPSDERSAWFWACNRGKRSVTLDLRTAGGARAFRALVATADVMVSNFQPGTMDAWGLGYEAMHAMNPRLIYATASALGPVGPDAAMEGADLTGQAMGGAHRHHRGGWGPGDARRRGDRRSLWRAEPRDRHPGRALPPRAHRAGAAGRCLPPGRANLGAGQRI